MRINEWYYRYFQKSVDYSSSSFIFLFIVMLIEQLPLFILNISISDLIKNYLTTSILQIKDIESTLFFKISLFHKMYPLISFQKKDNILNNGMIPLIANAVFSIIFLSLPFVFEYLEDSIIVSSDDYFKQLYGQSDVYNTFHAICSYYPFMTYRDDKILIKEVAYRLNNLNDQMENNLQSLYEINISNDMIDLFVILMMLFRPIRRYESDKVYLRFIESISRRYNIIIYAYLIVNSIFELMLFFLIKQYIQY